MIAIVPFVMRIITEPDNKTPSFIRIGTVIIGSVGTVLACVHVAKGHPFDVGGFFMGAATLFGGSGLGARAVEGPQGGGTT